MTLTVKQVEQFIVGNELSGAETRQNTVQARNLAATEVLQTQGLVLENTITNRVYRQDYNTATQVTENPDGSVIVRTAANTTRSIAPENLADYQRIKNNNLLAFEEDTNRANAIRRWGAENPQIVRNSVPLDAPTSQLLKADYVKDFDSFASQVKDRTGRLPYETPFTNQQAQVLADAEIANVLNRNNINGIASATTAAADARNTVTGSEKPLEPAEFKRLGEFPNAARNRDEETAAGREFNDATARSVRAALENSRLSSADIAERNEEASIGPRVGTPFTNPRPRIRSDVSTDKSLPEVPVTNPVNYNVLDEYDSYTYGIALHILDKTEYNAMVENAGKGFVPKNTLIASAGRNGVDTGTTRAPGWRDNFFFEKLTYTSVIGLNRDSRGTNVINIDFTLIEPMGLSLIDRLIRTTKSLYAAGKTVSGNNTTEITYFHNCYLLQIDFFDSQMGCLQKLRKFIPIKLTDLRIKVTSRGSEYQVSAVPFGHQALFQSLASTPANFECVAGTLRDFFRPDDAETQRAATAASQRESSQAGVANTNNAVLAAITAGTAAAGARTTTGQVASVLNVKSYVAAYNAWHKELKKYNVTDKTKEPTKIRVVLDKAFLKDNGDKLFREGIGQSVGDKPFTEDNVTRPANGNKVPVDKNKDRFVIGAGTQVTEVINMAMANSEYIRRQIIIPEKQTASAGSQRANQEGPLNWWKIIPSVKLLDFDPVSNKWSFDITYFVVPFKSLNTVHPHVPRAKPVKENCVREYEYLYTGKNTAVLDFQVDFDYMYFVKVLALRDKATDGVSKAETVKTEEKPGGDTNDRKSSNNISSPSLHHVTDENTAAGKRLRGDEIGMAVASVAESVYSSARGEMLNVTMKIIGDPAFIKQDDIFTGLARGLATQAKDNANDGIPDADTTIDSENSLIENNSSLVMDNGDLLVWVNLRLPVDMDTATGGVRKEQQGDISSFTGVYKVLMVENEFSKGQFTQTLQMIRYMDQPADEDYKRFNSERLGAGESIGRGNAETDNLTDPPVSNDSAAVKIEPARQRFTDEDEGNADSLRYDALAAQVQSQIRLEAEQREQFPGIFSRPAGVPTNPQRELIDTNQQQLINTFRNT